jgi:pimeloyl-[acyl-carrier protein] methyl ester esterase
MSAFLPAWIVNEIPDPAFVHCRRLCRHAQYDTVASGGSRGASARFEHVAQQNAVPVAGALVESIAIVLLPGLDGTGRLFAPVLPHLPGHIRPIVVRYPLEPLRYAELLPLVIASLPRDLPFVILGESFSGPLAVMVAEREPSGLCGVVLDATFVENPSQLAAAIIRPFVRSFLYRLVPSSLIARFFLRGGSAEPDATQIQELIDVVREVPASVIVCRVRDALAVNVADALSRLDQPILCLRGRHDHVVVPARNARQIARLGRDVAIREFDTGHMVLQTQPRAAAAAIVEFCDQVTPRAAPNQRPRSA